MRSYVGFIAGYLELMKEAKRNVVLGGWTPIEWPPLPADAPVVMGITAHPDDWPLTVGPLALRLRREGFRMVNVCVTLGRPQQYERRLEELIQECQYFGAEMVVPNKTGLRDEIKSNDPAKWSLAVASISRLLADYNPAIVVVHHDDDGHHDHVVVNRLAMEALAPRLDYRTVVVEGEYWKDMNRPNLQLEVSASDMAELLQGLSCHKGELERNRYDVFSLPHMHVNGRYAEIVRGWGTEAAEFDFSVMYRVRLFRHGKLEDYLKPLQIQADEPITRILPDALSWP